MGRWNCLNRYNGTLNSINCMGFPGYAPGASAAATVGRCRRIPTGWQAYITPIPSFPRGFSAPFPRGGFVPLLNPSCLSGGAWALPGSGFIQGKSGRAKILPKRRYAPPFPSPTTWGRERGGKEFGFTILSLIPPSLRKEGPGQK